MAMSLSGKSKIWYNRKAVGDGRASVVLGYNVRSLNMVDMATRLPSFGCHLLIRYLTSSLLLFPFYPSLVLPTPMETRQHGHVPTLRNEYLHRHRTGF
ncbi:Alpha-L-fucosidase 1 [Senna tora]|uniref:Alpha-L-fucosidase 1 n=1 Tax=Senna tora TaxID=362788 RepID=A0A834W7L9_9FABA|nr:Alpha-L-fucosidase 1 [Senna tora]